MARKIKQLTDRAVQAKKAKGYFHDGGGLYLQVSASGSKSWIYRFKSDGRSRDMGLGKLATVSLADAREKAANARRLHEQGRDPIVERDAQRSQDRLAQARTITFQSCAEQLIASHEVAWRHPKHKTQWRNTLATYAYPILGSLPVADVDTDLVLRVLGPIWASKCETATRLRGRIEAVLSWAKARGLRAGENPAQWRGHLDQLLPARSKVQRVVHHPALPYRHMPPFMARLRARDGITPHALELAILCASRTGEVLGAKFEEIDLGQRLWVVPGERMKGGKEHRVPLSPRAVIIVKEMTAVRISDYVFPGMRRDKPINETALLRLLRDLHPGVTVHGFRSSFRDWAAETTNFPREVVEGALAHAIDDKVEAAYRRTDLLERRRELMQAWAQFCEPASKNMTCVNPL